SPTVIRPRQPPAPSPQRDTEEHKRKHANKRAEKPPARSGPPATRASKRVASLGGSGTTSTSGSTISSANYRGLVIAELNRHKRYPEAARSAKPQGVAIVSFTIGRSGRVTSHSIVRSSGNSILDNAVHQMMGAVSLPPPPGGSFHASAPISFAIR